jgi:O-antigen ligase
MRRFASLALTFGLAATLLFWLAGPGGFETIKLLWLAIILLLTVGSVSLQQKASGAIVLYLIYLTIRAATSAGQSTAWLGTLVNPLGVVGWIIIGSLALILINRQPDVREPIWRQRALILVSWLVLIQVYIQHATGFGIDWITFDDPARGRELFGSIGSPAQLGVVTALLAGLLIYHRERRWASLTNWTCLALVIATLISGSATGIGLILIGGLAAIAPGRLVVGTTTAFVLVSALLITIKPESVKQWPSLADRGAIWQAGWSAWSEKPLWGWGPNHFALAYDRHYPLSQLESRALSEERAHNLPLEILVETGLIGLLLAVYAGYSIAPLLRADQRWLPAWLWLIASLFNPVIVPVAALGLLCLNGTKRKTTSSIRSPLFLGRTFVAIILLYVSVILVQTTVAADRAAGHSAQLEFSAAATVAERALATWPQHPQLLLIAAEARTNSALKTSSWLEAEIVADEIARSQAQAPFFTPALTRAKISQLWLQSGHKNYQFDSALENWKGWSNHPRAGSIPIN